MKSLSSRLAFSYLLFFILSASLLFGVLFYSVAQFMEQKDHDIIEVRFQQFQQLFEREGIAGLKQAMTSTKLRDQSARFLVFLKDSKGQVVFEHLPEEIENFDLKHLQQILMQQKNPLKANWYNIPSKDGDDDALEVRSAPIENGNSLHVGARTDERDEILGKIQELFMMLLLPLLFVTIIGAFFIAKRALSPIRDLIGTVSKIKNGDLSSRVSVHDTKDELFELSSLFNEMIERVEAVLNAMKDTLDNVAHDLKTPITRLIMAGELGLRSQDDAQVRSALEESIENSQEILSLIKSIMTVSDISTKTAKLNISEFDLNVLVEEVIDVYFFVAEEKNIKIIFEKGSAAIALSADRGLLKQAIANLIDNAIKYSAVESEVKIHLLKGEHVVVEIIDSGIGISDEDLPRIWERLYRADKSRHEPGLGLGLSMVRAIVEAHGGRVEVVSQVGIGSTFRINL